MKYEEGSGKKEYNSIKCIDFVAIDSFQFGRTRLNYHEGIVYEPLHPKKTQPKQNFRHDDALQSNHGKPFLPSRGMINN